MSFPNLLYSSSESFFSPMAVGKTSPTTDFLAQYPILAAHDLPYIPSPLLCFYSSFLPKLADSWVLVPCRVILRLMDQTKASYFCCSRSSLDLWAHFPERKKTEPNSKCQKKITLKKVVELQGLNVPIPVWQIISSRNKKKGGVFSTFLQKHLCLI